MPVKSNNIIDARIALKIDTEANWNLLAASNGNPGFIPMNGEVIIYSTDQTGHDYPRIKIGDGVTNVVNLPFIINGEYETIQQYESRNAFPSPGVPNKLYVALDSNQIYYYSPTLGYNPLVDLVLGVSKSTIQSITSWGAGRAATASINGHTLKLETGIAPQLYKTNVTVVTGVTMGGGS